MSFFKEIADYYRFCRQTDKAEKLIVFYAEHGGYYPSFEGLIDVLMRTYDRPFCYVTSDPHDPILQKKDPSIKTFYLNLLFPLFMEFVDCKVFIMTMPDLNKLHIKRSTEPVYYVYVFHSLNSIHMMYRDGAFDHYDSLLCVGPHQIKETRKYEELHQTPSKTLVEAGYYRLERIHETYKQYIHIWFNQFSK